jgi:hypothetical protein
VNGWLDDYLPPDMPGSLDFVATVPGDNGLEVHITFTVPKGTGPAVLVGGVRTAIKRIGLTADLDSNPYGP